MSLCSHSKSSCAGLLFVGLLAVGWPLPSVWTRAVAATGAPDDETRLLRRPTVSRELVAFAYAGDIWTVSRSGGQARRVTATPGVETDPSFSPDGSQLAFTATVAGNTDAYVVPSAGGEPKRLTWHPDLDAVRGWTPDGQRVIFASTRNTAPGWHLRLWTIGLEGGLPEPLAPPHAVTGALSPDGRQLAYQEISNGGQDQSSQWRHYRGGRTQPVKVMTLADYRVEKLPWSNSNDTHPMWIGNTVYFLSDRNHTVNLFAYRLDTKTLTELTHHDDFDIMSASAGVDAIVYEQAGYIHLVDTASGQSRRLNIRVTGDFPWAYPRFKSVSKMIRSAALSPTGTRVAFEARGDIFTVPAQKGDYRNLTQSPGVHEHSPAWSPDGTQLAWLSDASGEYQLMLGDVQGMMTPRALPLPSTAFFSAPLWSPDGKQMLLEDNHLNLWMIEMASGRASRIDTAEHNDPEHQFEAAWSPDSRWIAYSKQLDNQLRATFVYSLAARKTHQLTDGMADAVTPAFDASGRYLYFLASTDYALNVGWLDMSSFGRPPSRSVYLALLAADEPSPLLARADDAPAGAAVPAPKGADPINATRIDLEGIERRIVALTIPPGNYANLVAGAAGTIFYTAPANPEELEQGPSPRRLYQYQFATKTSRPFLEGIRSYALSEDKKALLYQGGGGDPSTDPWGVVPTEQPAQLGAGALNVAQLAARVDPRAEWANIFRETWRIQREFFYDPKMHGADWQAIYEKYQPLLAHVRHRADLTYLEAQMGGELTVGHSYAGGGDSPDEEPVATGLLGADFTVENGRYRIHKIYTGGNWNPQLPAPLAAPSIGVSEGDYLLEVNGRALIPPADVYSPFEGRAGKQTLIRVNRAPSLQGSRLVTVVPTASEYQLRAAAWVEENRRRVDQLSGGRLAYVWLPDTAGAGYKAFNREFYAQQHKQGVILDERYNGGGNVADYILNELSRERMGYFVRRDGKPLTTSMVGLYGPKVMLINESSVSGGDALPYLFRQRKLGPLLGTRTWGALVGGLSQPLAIDGGVLTAPSLAFYDRDGKWAVENEGVAPDIEVENSPAEVLEGRDPQLERAVQEALRLLGSQPAPRALPRPPPIDRASRS